MFPHHEIELCSALHVLATQYWPLCNGMFVWQRRNKKKRKITLLCGSWGSPRVLFSGWQAWCACPDLMLWKTSSLGSRPRQLWTSRTERHALALPTFSSPCQHVLLLLFLSFSQAF